MRVLGAAAGIILLLGWAAVRLQATPIKPDVEKLLARPQARGIDFAPARAGWDGPEMPKGRTNANPVLENLGPAASARAARAALLSAAIPDPRAVAGILLLILLLRRIRQIQQAKIAAAVALPGNEAAEEPVQFKPAA